MRRFIAWKQAVINRIIHKPWIVGVRQTPSEPAFNPADMFAPTTPGWVYDLSDFSTLFQDSAGTTPVTAVEQPVGLVLDKSQGLVLGPELAVNGSFASGATGWTIYSGASNVSFAADRVEVIVSGNFVVGSSVNVSPEFNANSLYKVEWDQSAATGSFYVALGDQGAGVFGYSGTGHKIAYLRQTGASQLIRIYQSALPAGAWLDNISVKLISGNHASQPTTTKRPVLSSRVNYIPKSEALQETWTGVTSTSLVGNAATAPSGAMTATKIVEGTEDSQHAASYFTLSTGLAVTSTQKLYIKAAGRRYLYIIDTYANSAYVYFDAVTGVIREVNACTAVATEVGNGWWCLDMTMPTTTTYINFQVYLNRTDTFGAGTKDSYVGDGVSGVYIWGSQRNYGGATKYQRTGASDYDTAGFPLYLKGDGIDDFMSTADIDFTGSDSVTTWTGVQKLQDATRGILYELGTDTNTVNGTFGSNAPDTDGGTGFWFVSRGTSRATAVVSGYPSPYKAVLTAKGRISTDTCSMQVNLDSPASTGADQGINAYISAPAYFGARAGTSLFFNGQSYSSVCLGRVATDEELDSTRDWVNDRTGAY